MTGAVKAGLRLTPNSLVAWEQGGGLHWASFSGIPLSKPPLDVQFEILLDPILFGGGRVGCHSEIGSGPLVSIRRTLAGSFMGWKLELQRQFSLHSWQQKI